MPPLSVAEEVRQGVVHFVVDARSHRTALQKAKLSLPSLAVIGKVAREAHTLFVWPRSFCSQSQIHLPSALKDSICVVSRFISFSVPLPWHILAQPGTSAFHENDSRFSLTDPMPSERTWESIRTWEDEQPDLSRTPLVDAMGPSVCRLDPRLGGFGRSHRGWGGGGGEQPDDI